jgi:hypothetical protein
MQKKNKKNSRQFCTVAAFESVIRFLQKVDQVSKVWFSTPLHECFFLHRPARMVDFIQKQYSLLRKLKGQEGRHKSDNLGNHCT